MVSGGLCFAAMSAQCKPPTHTHTQRGKTMARSLTFWRFLGMNSDLPLLSDEGVRINFSEEFSGRIELVIRVDEHTTKPKLERSWPLIEQWQKRLLDFQGPWISGGTGQLYFYIWRLWRQGKKPQWIANHLNERLADWVRKERTDIAIAIMFDMGIDEETAAHYAEDIAYEVREYGRIRNKPITNGMVSAVMKEYKRRWGSLKFWEEFDDFSRH